MGQLYLSIRTIFILTFFCHLPIVPAHLIENRLLKPLDIDQAYLTIHNQDRSSELSVLSTVVACEHCDFLLFANVTPNGNETKIIDTRYPYNFQFFAVQRNENLSCYIESYSFDEHGSYLLEVNRTEQNTTSCGIIKTGDSSYYYTPIIVGVILLFSFIVAIQVTHRLYHSQYAGRILTNIGHERLVNRENDSIASFVPNSPRPSDRIDSDILGTIANTPEVPLVASTRSSTNSVRLSRVLPKRLRGLDTFRGFSLMIMIFVNYGGGGYWFFDHSVWNGLTLADLVFPWFVWMMGASIVLSQRSLRTKGVFKLSIFLKICKRTCILFLLGLLLQSGDNDPKTVRILGVLQRLALCYFLTAIIVLWLDPTEEDFNGSTYPIGHDVEQPLRIELQHTILQFWMQWIAIILITTAWLIVTFVPSFENCPRGYVGPGGRHEHGNYHNCTGGMAGYIDRKILGAAHLYDEPTCKDVYQTTVPYDPEGILGILTGTVLCYLGVHAAHCFVHSTRIRRVCGQWIISGLVFGAIGLILSKGGHSESWIPINKNLWSLSFILILASLAYFLLTIFYLLVDVYQWFTGEPWLWLGMNSIVVYVGHEVCSDLFPVQFQVENTHAKRLAMNAYGVTLWMIVAGLMYYTKTFVAV